MDDNPPFCSNCGYRLSGLVDSSKCPECGRPLVEILTRASFVGPQYWRRYTSKATLWGWPVSDIALAAGRNGKPPVAKGIIAIGNVAIGGIAIGGVSIGIVPIGGVAIGACSLGAVSFGLLCALGSVAIGALATGVTVIGLLASGVSAIGLFAQGMSAQGIYTRNFFRRRSKIVPNPHTCDAVSWFFGRSLSRIGMLQPIVIVLGVIVLAAGIIGAIACGAWLKNPGKREGEAAMPGSPTALASSRD